jgi:uncharacterized DUF497 family protein
MRDDILKAAGFDWDEGNIDKNWYLHQVTDRECEEVFFNLPFIVAPDSKHSQQENRQIALGRTDIDRWLFVSFIIRNHLIRIISARDMNQKETKKYGDLVQRYSKFHD